MADRRFKFRAHVVLDLRRRRDEEAQQARAVAQAAVQLAEQGLAEAAERLRKGCEDPRDQSIAFEWYRNWIVGLRVAMQRQADVLAERHRELEEAVTRAMKTRRDLRVIERLRERRRRAFDLENTRHEQRQIDALAVQQYGAVNRASGGSV